jgi:hypothetical protein
MTLRMREREHDKNSLGFSNILTLKKEIELYQTESPWHVE